MKPTFASPSDLMAENGNRRNRVSSGFLFFAGMPALVCTALVARPGLGAAPPPARIEYVENDRVKVGVDLDAGGAIMYVEDKLLATGNMINYFDRGRQIQQSYYSGPVPYVGPKGEQPDGAWAGLGWNPIQTGDCAGNASPVLDFSRPSATSMRIRTAPMLWPHHGVAAECVFETVIDLTANGFAYRATIENRRSDRTDYGARTQEAPALYTNARWHRLVSYLGDRPWTGEAPTVIVRKGDGKGWPWRSYFASESWSALLDADGKTGIGVYNPDTFLTGAGFFGGDAEKGKPLGPREAPTGYIAPNLPAVLDANATLTYTSHFAVGGLQEIRDTFAALARRHPVRTGWTFAADRLGWTHARAVSQGWPLKGAYAVELQENAEICSPWFFVPSADGLAVEIEAAARTKDGRPLAVEVVCARWSPADRVDYPCWSDASVNVEAYRAEAHRQNPELPPAVLKAEIPGDGAPHRVVRALPPGAGAYKRVTLRFPGASAGTVFSLKRAELKKP